MSFSNDIYKSHRREDISVGSERMRTHNMLLKIYDVQSDTCIVISNGAKSCTMEIITVLIMTFFRNWFYCTRHSFSYLILTNIL